MRVTNSRVTNTALNRRFSSSVNDVHSKLNKAMNKISSGRAYESASENPLAYYEGKKLDNKFQDIQSQLNLLGDLKHRLEEQESGAYSIQTKLAEAQKQMIYIRSSNNNEGDQTVETVRQDFLQKGQFMANCLNGQYEDYYVFGGSDVSTPPFALSSDGMELTFTHKFPGDTDATVMKIKLVEKGNPPAAALEFSGSDKNGTTNSDTTLNNIVRAMKEQGRVDVGYGDISNRDTLLDTFTGGLNVLTGLNSDTVNKMSDADAKKEVEERLLNSPIFLLGQAVNACNTRLDEGQSNCVEFSEKMGALIDKATLTHSRVGTVYSDIGTKWAIMDGLETKHKKTSQNLQEQYKDKLGADPYESIMEMYSYQYSYSASLQMGSKLMQSSLFDFLR